MRATTFILPLVSAVMLGTVHAELEANQDYKNGMEALVNQLPEVAVKRLTEAAVAKELTDDERVKVLFRLCEAQVRARQGAAAEKTLEHVLLQEHADRPFWLAQALVAQGRLKEAAVLFEKVVASERETHKSLSLVALSELYRSLQQQDKAFEVLENAAKLSKLTVAASIQLAEAYYAKGDFEKARKSLEGLDAVSLTEKSAKDYLEAKLSLAEGKLDQAKLQFEQLIATQNLKQTYKEMSTLGVGDVLAEQGKYDEAVTKVVELVEQDGDSESLLLIFDRLIAWSQKLEDTATLDKLLEEWIVRSEVISEEGEKKKLELEFPDRDAFAHFLLAKDLSRKLDENDQQRALGLLEVLRESHPMHSLVSRSRFLTAEILLKRGQSEEAIAALEELVTTGLTDVIRRKAAMFIGLARANEGEPEKSITEFKKLTEEEDLVYSQDAQVNIVLLQLKLGNLIAFEDEVGKITNAEIRTGLLLEKGMEVLNHGDVAARADLIATLEKCDGHALEVEARFQLIKDLLAYSPIDPEQAQNQLEVLRKKELSPEQQVEFVELEMRSLVYNKKWDKVVELYLAEQKVATKVSDKMLISLGEAYYRNGEFNKARIEFNKLLGEEYSASAYREYADFYSALSARQEGTPQSKEEALRLFQQVIDKKSVFAAEAAIQKARLTIDAGQLEEAEKMLLEVLKQALEVQVEAHLKTLLADVYHRKGVKEKKPESLVAAENLYIEVLKTEGLSDAWKHRIYYLLGRTQELVDPSYARALDSYFKVVNLEVQKDKSEPVEWEWYNKCGLQAVELLSKEGRWEAAANLLEKMAGYFGEESDTFRDRAGKIRLEHHIF